MLLVVTSLLCTQVVQDLHQFSSLVKLGSAFGGKASQHTTEMEGIWHQNTSAVLALTSTACDRTSEEASAAKARAALPAPGCHPLLSPLLNPTDHVLLAPQPLLLIIQTMYNTCISSECVDILLHVYMILNSMTLCEKPDLHDHEGKG